MWQRGKEEEDMQEKWMSRIMAGSVDKNRRHEEVEQRGGGKKKGKLKKAAKRDI